MQNDLLRLYMTLQRYELHAYWLVLATPNPAQRRAISMRLSHKPLTTIMLNDINIMLITLNPLKNSSATAGSQQKTICLIYLT